MSDIKIGVALSGGTAKSVTHVGIIKALVEADIPIACAAGCSGGSIVASMFASGMPVTTMESIAVNMSWRKLASIRLTRLGFISSAPIEDFVRELIGDMTFGDMKIPLGVIATNLETGDRRNFTEGPVAPVVRASCSIPQLYLPVELEGRYYVDGGLAEYLPVQSTLDVGADFVIACHLASPEHHYKRPKHILDLIMQLTGLMARKNFAESEQLASYIIRPNLSAFGSFDFDQASTLVELGYEATQLHLDSIKDEIDRRSSWLFKLKQKLAWV